MERNKVVVVDVNDKPLGEMDKLAAHVEGRLHRAFSVFIFNSKMELLLQQRAMQKYHGAGLWTNTCCSHPQINEDVKASAEERLNFEMGLDCHLEFLYSFIYRAEVENNLIENELDYVFVGFTDNLPEINLAEAKAYKWMLVNDILDDFVNNPETYTYWFKMALPKVLANLNATKS